MSLLDSQNKTQLTHMNDMFRISVEKLSDNSCFPSGKPKLIRDLENEIERTYSKNILSTISKINNFQYHYFVKNEDIEIYFSICEYYTSAYDSNNILKQLQLRVKVTFAFKDDGNIQPTSVYYNLTIHILTDEAREFVRNSVSKISSKKN